MSESTLAPAAASSAFDIHRAMATWRRRYPDPDERIAALRRELSMCRGTVRNRSGMVSREYPRTEAALRRMLEILDHPLSEPWEAS